MVRMDNFRCIQPISSIHCLNVFVCVCVFPGVVDVVLLNWRSFCDIFVPCWIVLSLGWLHQKILALDCSMKNKSKNSSSLWTFVSLKKQLSLTSATDVLVSDIQKLWIQLKQALRLLEEVCSSLWNRTKMVQFRISSFLRRKHKANVHVGELTTRQEKHSGLKKEAKRILYSLMTKSSTRSFKQYSGDCLESLFDWDHFTIKTNNILLEW